MVATCCTAVVVPTAVPTAVPAAPLVFSAISAMPAESAFSGRVRVPELSGRLEYCVSVGCAFCVFVWWVL